jgi:DNA-binding IclR family transcriptional regulator
VYTVDELARELGVDVERARAACESLERLGAVALFGEDGVKFA